MSQHPENFDPFDAELHGLFARATNHIVPPSDTAARLQQRLARGDVPRPADPFRTFSVGTTLSAVLIVALLAGVLLTLNRLRTAPSGTGSGPGVVLTQTPNPTERPTTPFSVASIDLSVSPNSIAGASCGAQKTFTYTATFHVPANTKGGTIAFSYTLNNGRSQTPASVAVAPGATSAQYAFTSSGALPADHTYPGSALVMVSSPNALTSAAAAPSGSCVVSGPFSVKSVAMAVSPSSIAGKTCGSVVTVTYTATFHLAANGPGGMISFLYSVNNGRGSTPASIRVAPGQTTASYSFKWSGALPADHTYPEPGGVVVTSPNTVNSPTVGPSGSCS